MEAKAICTECGAEMLATTAAANRGRCFPCKRGTRKAMDESRRRLQERLRDPFLRYREELLKRVNQVPDLYQHLPAPEKLVYAVSNLNGWIDRGGFYCLFDVGDPREYDDALAGLRLLEEHRAVEIVQRARRMIFGDRPMPTDPDERYDTLEPFLGPGYHPKGDVGKARRLKSVNEEYSALVLDVDAKVRRFADHHELLEPHKVKEGQ